MIPAGRLRELLADLRKRQVALPLNPGHEGNLPIGTEAA